MITLSGNQGEARQNLAKKVNENLESIKNKITVKEFDRIESGLDEMFRTSFNNSCWSGRQAITIIELFIKKPESFIIQGGAK